MERSGLVPKHLQVILTALLAKPTGGFRPIGIFVSCYRLWGRCRRGFASAWEAENERDYLAGGSFASASYVVWRQAFRAEAARSAGESAAT
eukprot:551257-Pyramimonas_sp.AAC.1